MSETVTTLVIDSETSGADQFSSAMDKAGASAQSVALAVAGVGIGLIAAQASLRAFIDYVGNTNKQLVDLGENARLAGISTKEFQQILFAARVGGVAEKDFVSGLDKIGTDLTAASRGVTDFGNLFKQNGLSIRDTNGQLINTKTALNDIAGLMQNATPGVQRAIASIVGLSKDWIPFLREGTDEIEKQMKVAEQLGIIIDDATIQKAKDFDREWKQAVALWDTKLKASLVELIPLMVQLAEAAIKVINVVGAVTSFFSQGLTPDSNKTKAQLLEQIDAAQTLRDRMESVNTEFGKYKLLGEKRALGLPEDSDGAAIDKYIADLSKMYDAKEKVARVNINGGTTVLPPTGGGSDGNDRVDTAINTLRRHVEQQDADTRAVGLGAGALALFRAEAAQTSAVLANGGVINAKQAADFKELQLRAQDVAIALEKVRINYDIKRGRDTAFLSQEDVAIANQLRLSYPEVAAALNSVEAAGIRTNTAFRGISSTVENSLVTGLTDIAMGTKNTATAFQDMSKLIIRAIEEMIVKLLIIQPLMRSLQGALGSGISIPGFNPIAGITGSANGNAFDGGNVIPFARGGVIDGPMMAPMALMGEAGPEAIVPLRRGPDGNLGIMQQGNAGGAVNAPVNITIDARGADEAGTQRVMQQLEQLKAELPARVVVAVTQARKMRQL
jgi:hypothetical protein